MSEQKIDKLTPKQEALLPVYVERHRKIILDTTKRDRKAAETAFQELFKLLNLTPITEFFWENNPVAGAKLAAQMVKGSKTVTQDEVRAMAEKASYGSHEAYWLSHYNFISEVLLTKPEPVFKEVTTIMENCGTFWMFEGAVVITEKPSQINIDPVSEKVHSDGDAGIIYPDGFKIYQVHGEPKDSLMDCIMEEKYGKDKEKAG